MPLELASFFRTTLPLDLSGLGALDDGRYHSLWLPDHLVSFWPDSVWTAEFTDLAELSPSPHRYLDTLSLAGAVAARTTRTRLATSVLDTVRRHPVMLAQSALTLSHLSDGRFILGLGAGERENLAPYGFDHRGAVSRFAEALRLIRLLWNTDGPIDFTGQYFTLEHARLDTELHHTGAPPIWIGANGPRMLRLVGEFGDGWWPTGSAGPESYANQLACIREAAEQAGRDPEAITPAKMVVCLIGEPDELSAIVQRPLVKSLVLQLTADALRTTGHRHPMGEHWRGIQDIDPRVLTRDRLLRLFEQVDPAAILSVVPHGTPKQVAAQIAEFAEAGARVVSVLDYSGMAGQAYAAESARKVREVEDELLQLTEGTP
ncbi:luciferase [Mycolicibacterium conceptionense]|uniref:Luciferase n=1 Tax=Mycolicibacterium conceptionense TaxID=451644 RepID=A0A1A1ZNX3_9MYCO|nr:MULTISPECIES: LLM class flavin-dependent oxidoreductase [Mycolicibacterium]MCW1819645.1 LLM class flavin-dependent oxidoreductase [Mycolicibacterium senegalense]OBB12501.1 luciferase [Mycolicibacterium conceptionense]OBF08782.1 luciferase [Mycolicibacterium conceptionense]OBF12765.1 luciferase [Mycolicibacterium conceptionense]OBF45281.1 luciferase [Mycolicibacterium conceptionense]